VVYRRPRGTRDWLPWEAYRKRWVEGRLRRVFERYGYGEVITPAFESLELLVAKAGEEVKEQIYWFKDKAGRDLGLRFEVTTPVARIVSGRLDLPKPVRFYYILPVWRYEEPQKGRYREFWQAGVELIGVEGAEGDSEVIALTARALEEVGLRDIEIRVSDRRIVEDLLIRAGVEKGKIEEAFRVLDKLEKKGRDFVVEGLSRLGVGRREAEKLLAVLGEGGLDVEVRSEEGRRGLKHLRDTLEILEESYGVKCSVDFSIVRGLGYYTGLVFEVKAPGAPGSIAGGGRYDNLITLVGGQPTPATGMAIGVERLISVLEDRGILPEYRPVDVVVVPVSKEGEVFLSSIRVAETLRRAGLRVVVDYGRGLRKALEKASSLKACYAVIVGSREVKEGFVTVKRLDRWEESRVPLNVLEDEARLWSC